MGDSKRLKSADSDSDKPSSSKVLSPFSTLPTQNVGRHATVLVSHPPFIPGPFRSSIILIFLVLPLLLLPLLKLVGDIGVGKRTFAQMLIDSEDLLMVQV